MNGVTATLQRLNSSIGKTKVTIEKTEKGLRGEISQSLEESKKYTDESSSATLESANNYAQDAAQGAINAANNNTNEKLKSYYTKEENDNQFDATARGFTAQISSTKEELKKYTDSSASSTLDSANEYAQEAANRALNAANNNTNEKLKSYYTKEESDLQIKASSDSLSSTISKTQSKWYLVSNDGKKDYRNKKVNYGFGKTTNDSELLVDSDGKYYYLDVSSGIMYQIIKLGYLDGKPQYGVEEQTQLRTIESHTSSEISQISNEIVLKVDENGRIVKVSLRGSETGTEFKVNADNINLSANDVINLLSGGTINLSSKNITIISDFFSVVKGRMSCVSGFFSGIIASGNRTKIDEDIPGLYISNSGELDFCWKMEGKDESGVSHSEWAHMRVDHNGFAIIIGGEKLLYTQYYGRYAGGGVNQFGLNYGGMVNFMGQGGELWYQGAELPS